MSSNHQPRMNGDAESSTIELEVFDRKFVLLQKTRALDHAFALWDAGIGFVRFLEVNRKAASAFAGKRVLELGSGCGLVSMVLASLGAHALATDLPHVIPHLHSCIGANGFRLGLAPFGSEGGAGGGSIDAAALSWGEHGVGELVDRFGPFDFIIGTDVVYQDRPRTTIYFGNEERDATTHALFERLSKELFGAKLLKGYHPDSEGTSLRIYEGKLKPGATRDSVRAATEQPSEANDGAVTA